VPSVTPNVQQQPDTSLGKALNEILFQWQKHKGAIKQMEWRILNWHFANIEGPCGADISLLSLQKWDQDDPYEFDGEHCVIREGYGHLVNALASGLDIRLNYKVDNVDYRDGKSIRVTTSKGHFDADAVIVTLPLGVLKQG
jgi:lysine-specific histone demethylase 1